MHPSERAPNPLQLFRTLPARAAARAQSILARNPLSERRNDTLRRRTLTRAYLESKEYSRLMLRGFQPGVDGLDSAERETPNYRWRHYRQNIRLGPWRWLGVYEQRATLISLVFGEGRGLDFGGARGPLGFALETCDRLDRDLFRRPVTYHSLAEVPAHAFDFVWSSHALEHIPALHATLAALVGALRPGGQLALLLPAHTCTRWRAGVHRYRDGQGDSSHVHTFYLARDPAVPDEVLADPAAIAIDRAVEQHIAIEHAGMVGDNSIFILATN